MSELFRHMLYQNHIHIYTRAHAYYLTQFNLPLCVDAFEKRLQPLWMCAHYLREDKPVIVGVTWVFGSVFHGMKEKHGHDLCHAAA